MANRLNVLLKGGSGRVDITPAPNVDGLYSVGTEITITLSIDSGFNFINWTITRPALGTQVIGTDLIVVVTMGRSDVLLIGNLEGDAVAEFSYGPRLWSEYRDITNKKTRLVIEERGYTGESTRIDVDSLTYSIGDIDASPIETFVKSSLSWNYVIIKDNIDLDFLLTNEPRQFRVKYYKGYESDEVYEFIWVGYLKTSFFSKPEYKTTYKIAFTATDGLSDLSGYRVLANNIDFTNAMTIIASLLNQTFKESLPIKECVRVFENRMLIGPDKSVFTQYTLNPDFIFADEVRFQAEESTVVFNPTKKVDEALEAILRSFMVRLFQWNGYWYLVRVYEYNKNIMTILNFSNTGQYIDYEAVLASQTFECVGNPERRGEDDYTEFNVSLLLGSINRPEDREVINEDFGVLSWMNSGGRPSLVLGGGLLKKWAYVNAVEYDGTKSSEVARVERISLIGIDQGDYARIWCTANGLNDPELSGIAYRNIEYNSVVKSADTLTLGFKFQITRRSNSIPEVPSRDSHLVAIDIKINNNFLTWDGVSTFSWVTTPTKITIPVENTGVFNTFITAAIDVPEDGLVEVTIYQLITMSGERHRYALDVDDINLNLERNDALAFSKIRGKAVTGIQYSNVFPEYEIYTGDSLTNLASSAILLKDLPGNPVSNSWTREELNEEEPLIGILLQDLVNIFGKNNYSRTARIIERDYTQLNFAKGIVHNNKKNIILQSNLDDRTGVWDFQFYELSTGTSVTLDWSLVEFFTETQFIDANVKIFVNNELRVEAFGSGSGSVEVNLNDRVEVQYFYFSNLNAGVLNTPKIEFYKDNLLLGQHNILENTTELFKFIFIVNTPAIDIVVQSVND